MVKYSWLAKMHENHESFCLELFYRIYIYTYIYICYHIQVHYVRTYCT